MTSVGFIGIGKMAKHHAQAAVQLGAEIDSICSLRDVRGTLHGETSFDILTNHYNLEK